jgi:hypothetical protein
VRFGNKGGAQPVDTNFPKLTRLKTCYVGHYKGKPNPAPSPDEDAEAGEGEAAAHDEV